MAFLFELGEMRTSILDMSFYKVFLIILKQHSASACQLFC